MSRTGATASRGRERIARRRNSTCGRALLKIWYNLLMANQQLVDYIKSQLAAGVTKPDLQKAITTAGWSDQDSTDAFNVVEGKAPVAPAAPATPKPATPVQPAAQPVAQPLQQPVKPVTPVQQPMQPIGPTTQLQPIINPAGPTSTIAPNLGGPMRASTMQMNVSREGPASRMWLWVTLVVGAFVLVIAAAAFLFMPQIQEILSFYLGGGVPVVPVEEQMQLPPVPEPVATTTATTTPAATSTGGTVASSTASTTLGQ